jgi:hypothetical protein
VVLTRPGTENLATVGFQRALAHSQKPTAFGDSRTPLSIAA